MQFRNHFQLVHMRFVSAKPSEDNIRRHRLEKRRKGQKYNPQTEYTFHQGTSWGNYSRPHSKESMRYLQKIMIRKLEN